MGYHSVAALAHGLEDTLDAIRSGRTEADAAVVAGLLAAADELEDAVAGAGQQSPSSAASQPRAQGADAPSRPAAAAPEGTAVIAHVRLEEDAPIKGARAALILRALSDLPGVLGSDPAQFDEDFDGRFRIFF